MIVGLTTEGLNFLEAPGLRIDNESFLESLDRNANRSSSCELDAISATEQRRILSSDTLVSFEGDSANSNGGSFIELINPTVSLKNNSKY